MKIRIFILMCLFQTSLNFKTFGQSIFSVPEFGNGIFNIEAPDSSWSMKFALRFQTLFTTNYDYLSTTGIENGSSNFQIRRSRLKFDGHAFSSKLKYKVELGLSNRDIAGGIDSEHRMAPRIIYDAVLKYNLVGNLFIWAGQTKLPGNRERVISSGDMQFVDRSLLNARFNIDRDIGFQLRHHFDLGKLRIKEIFSLSQGEGRNMTDDNIGGYDWTGRLEFLPFGPFDSKDKDDYIGSALKRYKTPKLCVGVTYDFNDRSSRERGQLGRFM